ncbi:MAG: NADPH:quinone reductase [Pirellula sp.]
MKAAFIRNTGGPECIEVGDIPPPVVTNDSVLVRVNAVSVNPIDTYIRNGANYWPLPSPYVIGCDFAGEIVATGAHCRDWRIGQRVWGSNQGLLGRQGTFAEFAAIDPAWLYPSPDSVSDTDLAAVALVGITAHLGLLDRARLQPGETIFVRGGTGGVGAMVLQMAKAIGARVVTTAGSAEKAQRCVQLGADRVILYHQESTEEVLASEFPDGVNVFWETLREPDFDFAVRTLSPNGRMVVMAGRDARPAFPVGPFYVKGCSLYGFAMFKTSPESQRRAAEDINHWMISGKLRAQIDRIMELDQAEEAHRLQESNTIGKSGVLQGKLVLRVRHSS